MMKLMKKTGKNRNAGFTLVELIVVLVILGILAAIMVPALLGWIDKAKNQHAILECRSVVQAAQAQVAEEYGKKSEDDLEKIINDSETIAKIVGLAGVNGTLYNKTTLDEKNIVYHLEYETKNEVKVVYDRGAVPVYQLVNKMGNRTTSAPEHYDGLIGQMEKDGYITDGKVTEKLKDLATNTEWDKNKYSSQVLQQYYKEKVGDGENYPELDKETEALRDAMLKKGFADKGFGNLEGKSWRPIVTKEGEVVLVAGAGNEIGQVKQACVIYYEGSYYCWQHSSNKGLSTTNVSDKDSEDGGFSISDLDGSTYWVKVR